MFRRLLSRWHTGFALIATRLLSRQVTLIFMWLAPRAPVVDGFMLRGVTMSELTQAQVELRSSYRSGSVGQIYAGTVWLLSAGLWAAVSSLRVCSFC